MAYDKDKPASTDVLSSSQADIQGNFDAANTSFGINHTSFATGGTLDGYHKYIQFDNDYTGASTPAAPTGDTSDLFATKANIGNGSSPLPVFRNSTGVGYLMPMACLCTFAVDGTIDANTVNLNVASVARATSAPNYIYTITFDRSMVNANYTVIAGFLPNSNITVTKATATVKFTAETTISISGTIFIFGEIDGLA